MIQSVEKKTRNIVIAATALLLGGMAVVTAVMADESTLRGWWGAYCRYYEIYFYMLPMLDITICRFVRQRTEWTIEAVGAALFRCFAAGVAAYLVFYCIPLSYEDGISDLLKVIGKAGICVILTVLIVRFPWRFLSGFWNKLRSGLYRWRYSFAIFLILCYRLLFRSSVHLNEWASIWYVMDYRDGIGSRMLPGTLLRLITRSGFLSERTLLIYVYAALFLVIGMISVYFGTYLAGTEATIRQTAGYIVLLYLAIPANIAFLWSDENLGRIESFLLVFLLPLGAVFLRVRTTGVKYLLAGVGAVLCMATYQAFLFLYFPILFTMMICDIERSSDKRGAIIGCTVVCLATALSFLFFQFGSYVSYTTAEEYARILETRTDMEIDQLALGSEYFGSIKASWLHFSVPAMMAGLREEGFINLAVHLPEIILFVYAWRIGLCFEDVPIYRRKYCWILASDLLILIQFFLTMDWGRWFGAMMLVQFFQITYLHRVGDAAMEKVMINIRDVLRGHTFMCGALLLLQASVSVFGAGMQSADAIRIFKNIERLLER